MTFLKSTKMPVVTVRRWRRASVVATGFVSLWLAVVQVASCQSDVGGAGSAGAGAGMINPTDKCVGIEPPAEAFGAEPGPTIPGLGVGGAGGATSGAGGMLASGGAGGVMNSGGSGGAAMTGAGTGGGSTLGPSEIGSARPIYQLKDFQPLSCGYGATYGLDTFKGKVTVAVLLAGW
jgi:hypothetical protein